MTIENPKSHISSDLRPIVPAAPLDDSAAILHSIINNTSDLVAAFDSAFCLTTFNAAYRDEFQRLYGIKPKVGDSIRALLANRPDDLAHGIALWSRALKGEQFTITGDFGSPDHERHTYEVTYSPVHDAHGNIIGAAHIIRNISPRIHAEKLLQQTNALLRQEADKHQRDLASLVAALPDVVSRWSRQRKCLFMNEQAQRNTGQPVSWFLGKTPTEMGYPPQITDPLYAAFDEAARTRQPVAYEFTFPGPPQRHHYLVRAMPETDAQGEVTQFLCVHRNLTDLLNAREELAQRERELHTILFAVPDIISRWTPDHRLVFINQQTTVSGKKGTDVLHKNALEIGIPPPLAERWNQAIDHVVATKNQHVLRFDHTVAGAQRHFDTLLVPEFAPDGTVASVLSIARDVTDITQTQNLLAQSEKHLRNVLDALYTFVGVLTPDGTLTEANRAPIEAAGLRDEDVIGKKFWDCYWWSYDPAVQQQLRDAISKAREGTPSRYDATIRVSNNARMIIDFSLHPMRDAAGRITHLVPSGVDVTARKQTENALRASELRFRAIFDNAAVGIAQVNGDGHWTHVNQKLCDILGYSREELLARTFQEITHPDDLAPDLALVDRLQRGEIETYAIEKRYRRPDGQYVWCDLTASVVRKPNRLPLFYIAIVQDISTEKAAQQALIESERRFRELADAMPQIVWATNNAGAIIYVNQRWTSFTGTQAADSLGTNYKAVIHPDDVPTSLARWSHSLATGMPFENRHRFRRHDGQYRWQLARAVPVRDDHNRIVRWFGTCTDVHDAMLAEEELRKAKAAAESANAAKDHFLATLSHELRTPLNPALLLLTSIHDAPDLPPALRDDIATIRRNIELETHLIDDLLDVTRITQGKLHLRPAAVSVHELLQDAWRAASTSPRAKPAVQTRWKLLAAHDTVQGDATRLQQVFWNILTNAYKFTPDAGVISITTAATGDAIAVTIADTGIGMSHETANRIFQPFEQGSAAISKVFGGLGLGLALSKGIIDLHRGTIQASSDGPGTGTSFTITLPLAPAGSPAPSRPAATPPAHAPAQPVAARILLVEDHPDTRRITARLLREMGHSVHTAGSVAEAIAQAAAHPIDLVISDIGLPDGTGIDLLQQLTPIKPLPAIALSGFGAQDDIDRSRAVGFREHLTKPIHLPDLENAIQKTLTAVK